MTAFKRFNSNFLIFKGCWNCKKCENHSYVFDEFACNECDLGFWPNRNLTG